MKQLTRWIFISYHTAGLYLIEMQKGLATIRRFFLALLPRASGTHIKQILLRNASSLKSFSSPDESYPLPDSPDSPITPHSKGNVLQLDQPLNSSLPLAFRNFFATSSSKPPSNDPAAMKHLSTTTTKPKGNTLQSNPPQSPFLCFVISSHFSTKKKRSKKNQPLTQDLTLQTKFQDNPYENVTDFPNAVKKQAFIDNSAQGIKLFDQAEEAWMVNSYRSSGKSMFLGMIRQFYRIPDSSKRQASTTAQELTNPQSNSRNLGFFENLQIKKYPEQLENLGQFPVIFLDFKDCFDTSFETFYVKLVELLRQAYLQFSELSMYPQYNKVIKDFETAIEKVAKGDANRSAQNSQIKLSLKKLTKLLERFYQKKVIILIDEYDNPSNYIIQLELQLLIEKYQIQYSSGGKTSKTEQEQKEFSQKIQEIKLQRAELKETRQEINLFIAQTLGPAFKGNPSLEKGVLVGIFQSVLENSQSGLNNISVYNIADGFFDHIFGIQEEQVKKIMKKLFQKDDKKFKILLDNIRENYDGYVNSDNIYKKEKLKTYNVYSVIQYLARCFEEKRIITNCQSFWPETGSRTILKAFFYHPGLYFLKNQILSFSKTVSTPVKIKKKVNLAQIDFNNESKLEVFLIHALYSTGLLTGQILPHNILNARIPNREIFNIFNQEFRNWAGKALGLEKQQINFLDLNETIAKVHNSLVTYQKTVKKDAQETVLQTAVFGLWSFSDQKQFGLYQEQVVDRKKVNHIFVPMPTIHREKGKAENGDTEPDNNSSSEKKTVPEAKTAYNQDEDGNKAASDHAIKLTEPGAEIYGNTVIIHQYKRLDLGKGNIQSLFIQGYWQIFQKGYLRAICQRKGEEYVSKYPGVERVVLRSIVVAQDKKQSPCYLYHNKQDVVISMEQANKLAELADETLGERKEDVEEAFKRKTGEELKLEGEEYGRVVE